jgi:predicted HicB family RNase H-like nuclease
MKNYLSPKYPRVQVTPARHKKLATEAAKLKISIAELLESKLK